MSQTVAQRATGLYRLVMEEIRNGAAIDDVAFITFNYDLQVEKSLELLEKTGVNCRDGTALNFPYCYHLPNPATTIPKLTGIPVFERGTQSKVGVPVLKLHGSLNWYSKP